MRRVPLILLLLSIGCFDEPEPNGDLTHRNTAPTCSIDAPAEGAVLEAGLAFVARGLVADDGTPTVEWWSEATGSLGTGTLDGGTAAVEVPASHPEGPDALTLRATDAGGLSCEATVGFILRPRPTAPAVTVDPDPATTLDTLVLRILTPSEEAGAEVDAHIVRWTRDGDAQPNWNDESEVPPSATQKGETWTVEVRGLGDHFESRPAAASLVVVNSPPAAPTVTIVPEFPDPGDSLACSASPSDDPDGDPVTQTFSWTSDGANVVGDAVLEGVIGGGETWTCEVLAEDGDGGSAVGTASVSVCDPTAWYVDGDGDGWGLESSETFACSAPVGVWVQQAGDCDDTVTVVNPGALEVCNGVDDDCDLDVDGALCIDVSNVPATALWLGDAPLIVSEDAFIDTDTGEIEGLRAAGAGLVSGVYFQTITQANGSALGVFSVDGLIVEAAATLTVQGSAGLVFASSTDVTVDGAIDATGPSGTAALTTSGPNAGGAAWVAGGGGSGSTNGASGATSGGGAGAGSVPIAGVHYGNGGGGAGFCYGGGGGMGDRPSIAGSPGTSTAGGAGGWGGGDGGRGGDGGDPYGATVSEPLLAGSGGAGGVSDTDFNPNGGGGGGGAGGGAVQISAQGSVTIAGVVDASGGDGGTAWGGGGGGGSGGTVLIEAVDLVVSGSLLVEGGEGGDGNEAWQPAGTTGGSAGAAGSPGGGGGATESGGGGASAGRIILRWDTSETISGTLSPTLGDCAASDAM
jgi:hypothetical protein